MPQIRLLTYNIHKCIGGVDRKCRPERIAETIAHYDPDIALLQEVDDGVPRSRLDRQAEWLARKTGFEHFVFQPNVKLSRGCYGNAILSRHLFESTEDEDLTIPLKKRRRALITRIRVRADDHTRRLVVANVHLGLAAFERKLQVRKLLQTKTLSRTHAATPILLAGDFNDVWSTLGPSLLAPAGFLPTSYAKTFPAVYPLQALDRIYYRGELSLVSGFRGNTQLARAASDHLPLIADFEVA